MNNPALAFHTSIENTNTRWRRYAGISLAALLNGVLIWALASGLNIQVTKYVEPIFHTKMIDQAKVQPQPVPLPPTPQFQKTIRTEQIPEPHLKFAPDQNAQTITVQPQQQPQVQQQPDRSASGLTTTHTTPPYPAVARRLDQQGTVVLSITVAADGSVSAAQVATSSGVPELDQAALDWVKAHWRYKPAMQGGAAVPSTTQAAVKFDLKQVR
ncbi:MAG TPA: energy transducer TonB [Rhizomicrobium sp.]|jgi:protein TonB